jgi:hypothetical protein
MPGKLRDEIKTPGLQTSRPGVFFVCFIYGSKTAIPPRPKKPGGGRIAKPHVRHNLTIRADLSERLVKTADHMGISVTALVEKLIEVSM